MTFRAAGASKPSLRYVNSATFYVGTSDVLLKVNQTQLVGRYPTFDAAQLALEGILIKNGVKDTALAIIRLPKQIVYLSTFTVTQAINWADVNLDASVIPDWGSTSQRFNLITAPILVSFTRNNTQLPVYVKQTTAVSAANSTLSPILDGYTKIEDNQTMIVYPSNFVRIKTETDVTSPISLATTVTATNKATNLTLDTFIMSYLPPVP